jgi:signal transduction histidine kinase
MNEKLMEQIIYHAPNYIFWKDTNLVYRGCNHNFAQAAGFSSPEQVIGKNDNNLPWHRTADLYQAEDRQILSTKQVILNKEVPMVLDPETRMLSVSKVPLYDENKAVIAILGIYFDITEQSNLLKRSLQVKAEFLENMSHDIRTPLAGITNLSETIKNEATDSKIKGYAANLVTSSNALSGLLNSVLEVINVGSGEVPLLKKSFSLQEKLDEVIALNQAKAHQKNLKLLFDYDPAIPKYLIGDPTRLHRIALELVTNALNFTEKGHVRLSVQLAKDNKEDAIVKIVVEDTGIGIEPAKQQELYVRFKRFAPSYEGISKGFGLGLYVTKQFIDDLQGELYVESQIGVGSKFTAIIKLKKPLLGKPALSAQNSLKFP